MADDSERDAMTEACIEAGERVMREGSPALKAAMRIVLYILAREFAQRTAAGPPGRDSGVDGGSVNGGGTG